MNFLMASAYAQEAAPAAQPGFMNMIPMVLVMIIIYVFVMLPQKKKTQQTQAYVAQLKKGDEVYTNSGILGKIHGLTEKIVTLELEGGAKMKVLRTQIGGSADTLLNPEKK